MKAAEPRGTSCASGEPRERNRATDRGKNATRSATEAQPTGLRALAGKVLERNSQRNQGATTELRGAASSATNLSATQAEIRRLVMMIYAQDTPEDQTEALQHALSDPGGALEFYRWILSGSVH